MSTLSWRAPLGALPVSDEQPGDLPLLREEWIQVGRMLARSQTLQMIETIRQRAAAHQLDRGLSLSLPYFDDRALAMKMRCFQVIPHGRVMFVASFVVLAARKERAKVLREKHLSERTREHLLEELELLERAFDRGTGDTGAYK